MRPRFCVVLALLLLTGSVFVPAMPRAADAQQPCVDGRGNLGVVGEGGSCQGLGDDAFAGSDIDVPVLNGSQLCGSSVSVTGVDSSGILGDDASATCVVVSADPQTTAEEPPAATKQQTELYEQIKATADANQQNELFTQILQIAQEQFYVIGISLPAPGYGIAKNNVKNVPASQPGAWLYPNPAPTNPCQYFFE